MGQLKCLKLWDCSFVYQGIRKLGNIVVSMHSYRGMFSQHAARPAKRITPESGTFTVFVHALDTGSNQRNGMLNKHLPKQLLCLVISTCLPTGQ